MKSGPPASPRDRLAKVLAIVTVICLVGAFLFSNGTHFLMPGPLASAHGAIENCGACHTKSGSGGLGWIHGLVAGNSLDDSNACLTCHKMPRTALNPHGASDNELRASTERLTKIAALTPAPQSAKAQNIAFPTDPVVAEGLYCATCHQEHKGTGFDLSAISNEQCRSCHVVKFNSFDGNHPAFDGYPFKRRTRIIYDHAGHFGKHFPEIAKKDAEKRIPETCSTCHSSRNDKRVMAVAPFDQTCTTCHLDQITGKERVSGPKGIAFLTLPGLDLQTLKEKNIPVGEWPETSEAELTPFMKVMISRSDRGRKLINTIDKLSLQDLAGASDEQLKAVGNLAWEIKGLFYALISGKASDVLADLNLGKGAKLSPSLVADLTASIPRDVVISAHQEWLPNLATEMAERPASSAQDQSGWSSEITESKLSASVSKVTLPGLDRRPVALASGGDAEGKGGPVRFAQANQQVQTKNAPGTVINNLRIERSGVVNKGPSPEAEAPEPAAVRPAAAQPEAEAPRANTDAVAAQPQGGAETVAASEPPQDQGGDDLLFPTEDELRANPGIEAGKPAPAGGGNARTETASTGRAAPAAPAQPAPQLESAGRGAEPANARPATRERPAATANVAPGGADPEDDLLFPDGGGAEAASTEEPAGGVPASAPADPGGSGDGAWTANIDAAGEVPAGSGGAAAPAAGTVISIQSDVDPESWAEYGGWYRQDYAILYRPTGHKDKFIFSWLVLTGPQGAKGNKGPAAAVFDTLTNKDAQGSCTKCHSVDEIKGKGRLVNFSPPKVDSKDGRFTNFIHEPHFGILENRGCLTCHNLEKGRPYLKSYEQGNPRSFVSNFGAVKKELCQSCHTANMARQDCLLCHKYHINGVITPTMNTKIPPQ